MDLWDNENNICTLVGLVLKGIWTHPNGRQVFVFQKLCIPFLFNRSFSAMGAYSFREGVMHAMLNCLNVCHTIKIQHVNKKGAWFWIKVLKRMANASVTHDASNA